MIEAIIGALIGIGGTIVGWLLNQLSVRGRLSIFFRNLKFEFTHLDQEGCQGKSASIDQVQYIMCTFSMDVYNSSLMIKTMRDIKVDYYIGKETLLSIEPKNVETARVSAAALRYDEIVTVNIPARSTETLKCIHHPTKGLKRIWSTNTICLSYSDEKNRRKKVIICKKSLTDIFNEAQKEALS